jgi:hypothetical protein
MWPTTLTYQAALRGPHRRSVKVDVYDIDGNPRALGLRPTSGFVDANLTNRVTRSASFTLTRPFYPLTADDPLSPEHAVVQISAGIRYGTYQEELFPLFRGRIWDATLEPNGQVRFSCEDLAADVISYRFEQPRTTTTGTTLGEIRTLILEALPQAVFGTDTVTDAATPQSLTWDEDRGQALDDLAASLGGRWLANGAGEFTVRPYDYQLGAVAQEFRDGPGGLLTGATVLRSRAGVSNSIVVVSERTDGSPPLRVPARDSTTGSPTQFGGLFGRVSTILNVQTPLSFTAAQMLAQTQLRSSIALGRQWSASVVPDMSLEPGDTAAMQFMDVRDTQIIDSIRYPLETQAPMEISTRAGTTTGVS